MNYLDILRERFSVRRRAEEKEAFLNFVKEEMEAKGYRAALEEDRLGGKTLVFGDPERAALLLCAHYDTPSRKLLPDLRFPGNPMLQLLSELPMLLLLLIPAFLLYFIAWTVIGPRATWVFLLAYVGLLFLQVFGPANPRNYNQSSGLAALLTVMASVPEAYRSRVAFVLFDQGEKSYMGARQYGKAHLQTQYTRLMVELGPVGEGDVLFFLPKRMARKTSSFHGLLEHLKRTEGMTLREGRPEMQMLRSDFSAFQCGCLLMSAKHVRGLGYMVGHLHTPGDTHAEAGQVERIAASLVRAILGERGEDKEKVENVLENAGIDG